MKISVRIVALLSAVPAVVIMALSMTGHSCWLYAILVGILVAICLDTIIER